MWKSASHQRLLLLFTAVAAVLLQLIDLFFDMASDYHGFPYVFLVLTGLLFVRSGYVYLAASACTILVLTGFLFSPHGELSLAVFADRTPAVFGIWLTTLLVMRIRKHEQHLSGIVETINDAILTTDDQGRITSVNRAATRQFAYPEHELLGRNVSMLLNNPDRREGHVFPDCYRDSDPGTGLEGVRRDGTVFPVECAVSELDGDDFRGYVGVIHDITKRKRDLENLRTAHQFNTRLINTARVIILLLDPDGRIVSYNPYMEELTGIPLEEVRGRDWFASFIPEGEVPEVRKVFDNAGSGIRTRGYRNHVRGEDGTGILVEWYDNLLTDADGMVTGILAIGLDISERKKAEDMAAARSRQLSVLCELGEKLLGNPGLQELMEQTVRALADTLDTAGVQILELLPDRRFMLPRLVYGRDSFQAGSPAWVLDEEPVLAYILNTDEAVVVTEPEADPRFGGHPRIGRQALSGCIGITIGKRQEPFGVLCVYMNHASPFSDHDVDFVQSVNNLLGLALERRQAETRMRDLQNQLLIVSRMSGMGELGTSLAHELNQPLTALMNYLQACRRTLEKNRAETAVDINSLLDKAVNEADRAAAIINHLRDYVETGVVYKAPENLVQVVRDVCELIQEQAAEKKIRVSLDLPEDLPRVDLDRIQIHQVVYNLLNNSLRALEHSVNREILVGILHLPGMIEVRVRDTGPGVDPDILEQPFRHVDADNRRGMGIGLSICKSIIEAHGGGIRVSDTPGGGATFYFTLPV